jgi:hypothetical protein
MDSSAENLESELSMYMKLQKMDIDEEQYVGLIKTAISCKEDISVIQVCLRLLYL